VVAAIARSGEERPAEAIGGLFAAAVLLFTPLWKKHENKVKQL
jgi:hypothetical protein